MFRALRFSPPKKISFVAGLVLAFSMLAVGATFTASKALAATPLCNSNVIIYCGVTSPSNFISKVRDNNSGNNHRDLQAIYAHYGLTSAEYDRFVNNAVQGTVYRDGRVVVAGKTVLTAGQNLGREADTQGSGSYPVKIGTGTYYGNANSRTFRADQDALPAYILLDSMGQMEFGVITVCGNPVWGSVVKSSAACTMLNQTPVTGKLNTYDFTASATATGNATVTKYVYDFGDGTAKVTTTSGTQAVRHTYTKAGNFTAKVTVFASTIGNGNVQLPAVATCAKVITIKLPFYNCVALTGAILNKEKYQYSFTAKANFGNGATFTSADFNFGDNTTANGVKPTATDSVTVTHVFPGANKYNVSAVLHFSVNGSAVTAPACTASVSPEQPPTPTCKPNVPVGSPECAPCVYDSSLPSDSPQCVPPVLPNTGAGNSIAIFGAVVVGGFLVYRQLLFRKHKAAFLAAEQGTSALPLGDPLSNDAPLAGTPLQTKRRSFRRNKRQF